MSGNELSVQESWDVVFRPFSFEVERLGFDEILTQIADTVHDEGGALPSQRWRDIHMTGRLDQELIISVYPAGDCASTFRDLQRDVACLIFGLGIQGSVRADVVYSILDEGSSSEED